MAFIGIKEFNIGKIYYLQKEHFYEQYMDKYKGRLTEEKKKAIEAEIAKKNTMEMGQREAFELIEVQYQNLKDLEQRNIKGGFVSSFSLEHFFFEEYMDNKRGLFLIIALLLSLAGIFYQDTKNQMISLLQTTKRAQKIYTSKLKIAAILGGSYTILLWGPYYVSYFIRFGTDGLEFPIQSLPEFSTITMPITIAVYMGITMLIRIIIGAALGIAIAFLAQFLQSPTNTIVFGIIVLIFPLCLLTLGSMQYPYNSLIEFIRTVLVPYLKPINFLFSFNAMYQKGIELIALFWVEIMGVLFALSYYLY